MEYLRFSRLSETDIDDIIFKAGGKRFTSDPSVSDLNCDYFIADSVIELKIIEEEPIEKRNKQLKLAKLFRSDIKTVILNPLDLDDLGKRKYYKELAAPIKTALKKASKQLQVSAKEVNANYRIAILLNNGLSMTTPDEFHQLAIERATNDTSGIDILIVGGVYHYCDTFETIALAPFDDVDIQNNGKPHIIDKIREFWNLKIDEYMTKQIRELEIERTKEPIQDIFFEIDDIRYVKPPMQWGKDSSFFGPNGRPRMDSTGMDICPPVGIILPVFDSDSYEYVKENIIDDEILRNSLREYLNWAENEKNASDDKFKPLILILLTLEEVESLGTGFFFSNVTQLALSKYRLLLDDVIKKSMPFPENPLSLNYILLQVNEIGIDKANDIAVISHNKDNLYPVKQNFLIKGERMKFEYALVLASSYCLSAGADIAYYFKNDDFKWK